MDGESNATVWIGATCELFHEITTNISEIPEILPHFPAHDCLPSELREISESSFNCVIAYCVVFVIATTSNLLCLKSQWNKYNRKHSRITLLLLHLSLADLIVCCTIIPTEVFWRLTIQWLGGNLLCKVTQFLRAFGLYLSSLVLICVSFDRFLAIMFPMNVFRIEAYRRIKLILALAWNAAALFSAPQAVYFNVEVHPEFPSFKQCVTSSFLANTSDMKIYSVFSVAVMYFLPLIVIVCTYSAILWKIVRKSYEQSSIQERNSSRVRLYQEPLSLGENVHGRKCHLRCSSNLRSRLNRARTRTLLMTVVIVLAFLFCWTPYVVMTMWYMLDWEGAEQVDPAVQDVLFLMVVANSCMNPIIYGTFTYDRSNSRRPSRSVQL